MEASEPKKQPLGIPTPRFIFNLSVMVPAVDMVLADSIVPVLRWRGELATPIVMYKQKEPNILTLHVDGALEVFLDPFRTGNGLRTASRKA